MRRTMGPRGGRPAAIRDDAENGILHRLLVETSAGSETGYVAWLGGADEGIEGG